MSAFMVSNAHINALVTFITDHRILLPKWDVAPDAPAYAQANSGDEQAIGDKLIQANRESLVARYGESERLALQMNEDWVFKVTINAFKPIEIIKAADCFDYQACEVTDYNSTWAADVMSRVRATAIRQLPGYEAADWEIKRGYDDAPTVYRLTDLVSA